MALSITCPHSAQYVLHSRVLGNSRGSLDVVVAQFLRHHNLLESDVRMRASRECTTISTAVRRYVVEAYPDIAEVWPERRLTANQILGIARRSKNPNDVDELKKALRLLAALVQNPHDRRMRNSAKRMLDNFGISYDDLEQD